MGQFAATNIMKLMLIAEGVSTDEDLLNCPSMDPMMALSIGSNALIYQEAMGVVSSEELKETVIGRGMGIDGEITLLLPLTFELTCASVLKVLALES
jgi:hypothetical protein